MSRWLIRKATQTNVLGPYTDIEVAEHIKKEEISLNDFICQEGYATWTTIGKRKEITQLLDIDLSARQAQYREQMDASQIDDIFVKEGDVKPPEMHADDAGVKTTSPYLRWGVIGLGVFVVFAALLTHLVTSRMDVIRRPIVDDRIDDFDRPPIPEAERPRPRRPVRERPAPLDPRAQPGITRYSDIDPSRVMVLTEGDLLTDPDAEPTEPRRPVRRLPPEPVIAEEDDIYAPREDVYPEDEFYDDDDFYVTEEERPRVIVPDRDDYPEDMLYPDDLIEEDDYYDDPYFDDEDVDEDIY